MAADQPVRRFDGQARGIPLHEERCNACRARRWIRLCIDTEQIGLVGVRHPGLGPVESPGIAFAPCRRLDRRGIGADLRFGQTERAEDVAFGHAREIAFDLRRRAAPGDAVRQIVVHHETEGEGEIGRGDGLEDLRGEHVACSVPALVRGHQQRAETGLDGLANVLIRHGPGILPAGSKRGNAFGQRLCLFKQVHRFQSFFQRRAADGSWGAGDAA